MKLSLLVAFVACVGLASAMCPNSCSGHGTCGASDACTCYGNWIGSDCSARKCAYGLSWVDTPTENNVGHAYSECSSKGLCDRKTGQCKCFDGYEGKACRRSTCPNGCSGHGTCEYISELAPTGKTYKLWDANKIQGCKCDRYWSGYDCSSRICPMGDDPLTTPDADEVQEITVTSDSAADTLTGSATLTFTDKYGGKWTTRPFAPVTYAVGTATATANAMKAVLEDLPNHVIESVTVTAHDTDVTTMGVLYKVTFSGSTNTVHTASAQFTGHNTGDQNTLTINCGGCAISGCMPLYTAVGGTGAITCASDQDVASTREATECSNRGNCDATTGLCECFEGYTDENCSEQSALV